MDDPSNYLIRSKGDDENAHHLVALGYPAVAPVLSDMLEWIQDMNWPVAQIVAPFLASIGQPIVVEVRKVFESDDYTWQYWCISEIIAKLPANAASELLPLLRRLAFEPTDEERYEELNVAARAAIEAIESGDAR